MHLTTRLLMSIALAATSVASGASDAPPDALHRVQAYDGPARPRSEVAILLRWTDDRAMNRRRSARSTGSRWNVTASVRQ
jgi:hypothetical protein